MSQVHGVPGVQRDALPMTVSNGAVGQVDRDAGLREVRLELGHLLVKCGNAADVLEVERRLGTCLDRRRRTGLYPCLGWCRCSLRPRLTVHPLAWSSDTAALGLYGYGFDFSNESTKFEDGLVGTGP